MGRLILISAFFPLGSCAAFMIRVQLLLFDIFFGFISVPASCSLFKQVLLLNNSSSSGDR